MRRTTIPHFSFGRSFHPKSKSDTPTGRTPRLDIHRASGFYFAIYVFTGLSYIISK